MHNERFYKRIEIKMEIMLILFYYDREPLEMKRETALISWVIYSSIPLSQCQWTVKGRKHPGVLELISFLFPLFTNLCL